MTGAEAVVAVERRIGSRLYVQTADAVLDAGGAFARAADDATARVAEGARARMLARAAGAAAAGERVAVVVDAASFDPDEVAALAERPLAMVVHVVRADGVAGDDPAPGRPEGAVVLTPGDPQEAADLALAARRIAEEALVPVVVVHDARAVADAVRPVDLPDDALVRATAGAPDDEIACATPAQRELFGETRRRLPRCIDPLHPAGVGAPHGDESAASARLARRRYVHDAAAKIVDDALAGLAALTGRDVAAVSAHATDDADVVVVTPAPLAAGVLDAVDAARAARGPRTGALVLRVLSPWPAEALARRIERRRVAVFDAVSRADATADAVDAACGRRAVVSRVVPLSSAFVTDADAIADVLGELAGDSPRARIAAGLRAGRAMVRYPVLQAFEQRLRRDAPEVARELFGGPLPSIPPEETVEPPEVDAVRDVARVIARRSNAPHEAAAAWLRALEAASENPTRWGAWPETSAEPLVRPAALTLAAAHAERRVPARFASAALVTDADLVDELAARDDLARGATVFVATAVEPEALVASLSRRARRWLRRRALRLVRVDLGALESTTERPTFADQLAVWMLLGAWSASRAGDGAPATGDAGGAHEAGNASDAARKGASHDARDEHDEAARDVRTGTARASLDRLRESLASTLRERLGDSSYLAADALAAFDAGTRHAAPVELPAGDDPPVDEVAAPWTVTDAAREGAAPATDAVHLWQTIGYLYEHGDAASVIPDPVLAGGLLPARTGAFHDRAASRIRAPRWLPEACTGCGLCWAHCPDSALPARILRVDDLVAVARRRAEREGTAFVQMARLEKALVRNARRVVADAAAPTTADEVLGAAFDAVRAKLDDATAEAAAAEVDAMRRAVAGYPVSRTARFFDAPESNESGSGALLSITPDPHACTACGVCISVCDDGALEWEPESAEREARARAAFDIQRDVRTPRELLDRHVREGAEGSALNRMLDDDVFHAMVGGGSPLPGGGPRSALRLVLAGATDVAARAARERRERLDALLRDLEEALQGQVGRLARVNDFDDFARRLDRIAGDTVDASALEHLVDADDGVSRERLERLARARERIARLRDETEAAVPGPVLAFDAPSARLWGMAFPYNPFASPWIVAGPGDGAATALGLADALAGRALDEARAEVEAARARDDRAPLASEDELDEARALAAPAPVIAVGDAATMRVDDVDAFLAEATGGIVVAIDRVGAGDAFEPADGLDAFDVARRHAHAFVASTSIGAPEHAIDTVRRALASNAPAFVRVHAPDPERCGIPPERIAHAARDAVAARIAPLFVREPHADRFDLGGNPDPEAPFARERVTFRRPDGTMEPETIARTPGHWAVAQARFAHAVVDTVPAPAAGVHVPLEAFDPADESALPVVTIRGRDDRRVTLALSREVAAWTRRVRERWEALCRAATPADESRRADAAAGAATTAPAAPAAAAGAGNGNARERLVEGLLRLCGAEDDPAFFTRTLREFVLSRRGGEAERDGNGDGASASEVDAPAGAGAPGARPADEGAASERAARDGTAGTRPANGGTKADTPGGAA